MLILNKKSRILASVFLALWFFLISASETQAAISPKIKQAKVKNSPAVYFLNHKYHRKKVYLSAASYLGYNNKWSDVKTVSATDLAAWPEAKLIKLPNSPAVYYIKNNTRSKIQNWSDLEDFYLSGEPILEVNQNDLEQYRLISYEEIGLVKASNLLIFNDLVTSPNNNTLITNTDGNLAGVFRFRAPSSTATITSLTLSVAGVYNSSILSSAFLQDESDAAYEANISLNANTRQFYVYFRQPIVLNAGEEKTIKVFLNFKTCACNNQSLRLEIKNASDINSSLPVSASFPIQGTTFKIISGDSILGKLRVQEQSLAGSNLTVNNGSRLIGKYKLYEDNGQEDVTLKTITFTNSGSAGKDDWEDFRLLRDGQLIARSSAVSEDGNIFFNINYLRLTHSQPLELTLVAGLKTGYRPQNTFDLQFSGTWAVGTTYNLSLQPQLNNINETFTLN